MLSQVAFVRKSEYEADSDEEPRRDKKRSADKKEKHTGKDKKKKHRHKVVRTLSGMPCLPLEPHSRRLAFFSLVARTVHDPKHADR